MNQVSLIYRGYLLNLEQNGATLIMMMWQIHSFHKVASSWCTLYDGSTCSLQFPMDPCRHDLRPNTQKLSLGGFGAKCMKIVVGWFWCSITVPPQVTYSIHIPHGLHMSNQSSTRPVTRSALLHPHVLINIGSHPSSLCPQSDLAHILHYY